MPVRSDLVTKFSKPALHINSPTGLQLTLFGGILFGINTSHVNTFCTNPDFIVESRNASVATFNFKRTNSVEIVKLLIAFQTTERARYDLLLRLCLQRAKFCSHLINRY